MKNKNRFLIKKQAVSLMMILMMMAPVAIHAQQSDLQQVIDRAITAGMDRDQMEQIRERAATRGIEDDMLAGMMKPVADLAEKGMPGEFMVQKMLEGFAKGVPADRMLPVIESIHQHTPTAMAMSEQWLGRAEVSSFAQAMGEKQARFKMDLVNASLKSLTQRVEPEAIESVLNELGRASLLEKTSPQAIAAAIGILPDMPASMKNEAGFQHVIAKAVQGGFSAADIQKLPGAMNAAERRSQLPAASILNGMSEQLGSGIPANQVLQNLFNGNINAGPPEGIPGRPDGKPGGNSGQGRGNGNGGF